MTAVKLAVAATDAETNTTVNHKTLIGQAIANSWSKIAPFWPLKNLIAVNPVAGFENLPFEAALKQANAYFQQRDIPVDMKHINRESIKWLQAFFDEGQATIQMPNRQLGLLRSTLSLLKFDKQAHQNNLQKKQWLEKLPQKPQAIVDEALQYLDIPYQQWEQFLTLMLTTLPGWAAHVQYRTNWADARDAAHPYPVTQTEYLAFRLVLTCLIWPTARDLVLWHQQALENADVNHISTKIAADEIDYQTILTEQLSASVLSNQQSPENTKLSTRAKAQLVFCIDVRSEPFRRALEAQGNYQTYGFAGFFGVPVSIENAVTGEIYASCPVLLKPAHTVIEHADHSESRCQNGYQTLQSIKKLYQSLKYNFTTPFSLVETIGLATGVWMTIKNLLPGKSTSLQSMVKRCIASNYTVSPDVSSIPFEKQITYGAGALKMMGLVENFAPLVVFCGHGSTTQNNAYATALDCGACGGRHGASNARILAAILNADNVRDVLNKEGINIPADTRFLAAEHNTTTDEVEIYADGIADIPDAQVDALKRDLERAKKENSLWRSTEMDVNVNAEQAYKITALRARDWAQVRPEWGLARNAAFIIGPRWFTKDTDLQGRAFLHSYEWRQDIEGASLSTIMTAPMVVAQWINAQYLFSTLDNVAFGGGSKITKNITGKIGVMQGNASDLMHGLPLQSVFKSDIEPYHRPLRLTVIVYAPKTRLDPIIEQHAVLQKLFGNGWLHLICYDPHTRRQLRLQRDFQWIALN